MSAWSHAAMVQGRQPEPACIFGHPPRNTVRLKHVSADTVSSRGGGAGNESEYADAVPNGGPAIVVVVCEQDDD